MFIQGGSNAAVASLGLLGANSLGVEVAPLNLKQLAAVFLAGAIIKTLRFLEASPIPDFDPSSGDTTITPKDEKQP
jgi:hypothetical protein